MLEDDTTNGARPIDNEVHTSMPNSAPPSFRSRASSSASRRDQYDSTHSEAERMLAETFDDGENSDGDRDDIDDRQCLIRQSTGVQTDQTRATYSARLNRRMTEIPSFVNSRPATTSATRACTQTPTTPNFASSNDGVFANLDAKPELGEKLEEQPPVGQCSCTACLGSD